MADPQREPQTLDELLAEAVEAEASGETAPAPEGDSQVDELDALRAERDDYRDRFLRTLADAENARKRAERAGLR